LGIEVAWLTGRLTGKARRILLERLAAGEIQVAVGTHALFQEAVAFAELALVIVDEQHRFGVHQRLALREKGQAGGRCPHQLIMTATPIPRTLAMSAYADLDTSIIDELPPGRRPVKTVAAPDSRRDEMIERIRQACRSGRQAYWVCPLIEESESAAMPGGDGHGRVPVRNFAGTADWPGAWPAAGGGQGSGDDGVQGRRTGLLVATTVIEVGVDVPNASLMIIENAERLGLAQLHQLRGRSRARRHRRVVACCCTGHRCPQSAHARLAVLRECHDGLKSPAAIWSCVAPARCSAPARPVNKACGWLICCVIRIC
jgi:ATP-dependent DNA helicase RecG